MSKETKESITEKKVTRRQTLKWAAALAAAGAIGVGVGYGADELMRPPAPPPSAPASLKPPLSPEIQTRVDAIVSNLKSMHEGDEIFYSSCPLNGKCYGPSCVIKVHVKNGRMVCIDTDDTVNAGAAREDAYVDDKALSQHMMQARACQIGHAYRLDINSPTRVIYPMKQVGERGSRNFVRISWEEALDTIAKKMVEVKQNFGPYSIFKLDSYLGPGWMSFALAPWFGAGVGAWGTVSYSGTENYEVLHTAYKPGWSWATYEDFNPMDLLNSKIIIMWGWNPAECSYEGNPYYIRLAREKLGTPVICIEPRYTKSAETLADQWIPIKPTTDHAMLLAIANVILKEDLWDHDYVAKWVEPAGFEKWKNYVLGTTPDEGVKSPDDKVDHTPEWAAPICGVPAQTTRELARLYAKTKPAHLQCHWSVGKHHRGDYATAVAQILQTMTGNLTIHGGCASGDCYNVPVGDGTSTPFPYWNPALASSNWTTATYEPIYPFWTQKWAEAVVLREAYDKKEITKDEYYLAIGNDFSNPAPNIQCIVTGGNDVNNYADINKRIRAMKKVYFTWGWAGDFTQPTTMFLDIVLPRPYDMFENLDTADYRFAFAWSQVRNYFTFQNKCFDPPGEIRHMTYTWVQLANRLGFGADYSPDLHNVPFEEWDKTIDQKMKTIYEDWASRDDVKNYLGYSPPTSWEEFKKKPVVRWPVKDPWYAFKDLIEAGKNPFEKTPSGKIEFYSNTAAAKGFDQTRWGGGWDPLPRWQPSYDAEPPNKGWFDPKVTKYPLLEITPVTPFRQHSRGDSNPLLNDCYRHAVWISPADAKARGIKDDDTVRVYSETGEAIMPAYVTSKTMPGVVVIHHGAWYRPSELKTELDPYGLDTRGACNIFLDDVQRNHAKTSILTKGLVEVEKFSAVVR